MDPFKDVNAKYLILDDLGKAVKLIHRCSTEGAILTNDSSSVQSLSHALDRNFRHGLRDLQQGYWPLVQEFTHSATLQIIDSLVAVHSPLGKGRAWIYLALTEGSLESYLHCLLRDNQALRRHYTTHSLMRDRSALQQFVVLVASLQNIQFYLDADVSYLDMSSQAALAMTSSITSSLASPVDSGVAMLDSDLDATSVSEATSLRDDDSSVTETEDNKVYDDLETENQKETSRKTIIQMSNSEKPIVREAILYKTLDGAEPTAITSAATMEKALFDDVGAHFLRKMTMHSEESKHTKISKLTASDIANRNIVEQINCDELAPSRMANESTPKKQTDCEEIVYRRQRKKNKSDVKIKRVSFHEDLIEPPFSASFLPPNPIIKKDAVKGRYSWCGEGDSPYSQRPNNTNTRSVYLTTTDNRNIENSGLKNEERYRDAIEAEKRYFMEENRPKFADGPEVLQMEQLLETTKSESFKKCIMERGTPEGQEDPQRTNSSQNLSKFSSMASSLDCFSDTESAILDYRVKQRNGFVYGSYNKLSNIDAKRNSMMETKKSLLNRFLKLVTAKKMGERKTVKIVKQSRSMLIKGVKADVGLNKALNDEVNREIEALRGESTPNAGTDLIVDVNLLNVFKCRVFENTDEVLLKVFPIRSCYFINGASTPLLLLLMNAKLYITGIRDNYNYCNHLVLPYSNIDTILVGPNSHTLQIISTNNQQLFLIAPCGKNATHEIVAQIELAMRRNPPHKPPGVKCIVYSDMVGMKHSLVKQAAMLKSDELCHYNLVQVQDNQATSPCTPLGPTKEGHLMYRSVSRGSSNQWIPGYFILKAGVVYMFEDQGHRLPKHVVMLRGGQCKGCQRTHGPRPHTFQMTLSLARSIQFAAPDEYQASDWLQAFIQAAAGDYQHESVATTACSLVLTSRRIVTCKEQFPSGSVQVLTVGDIEDLAAFHADADWCVLEFACQEVHESSGDWIVYFASVEERISFQDALKLRWSLGNQTRAFPLNVVEVAGEELLARCVETSQLLSQSWDHLMSLSQ